MIEELENFEFLEKYKYDLKKIIKYLFESFMEIDEDDFEIYKNKIQINENNDNYKKIISKLKDGNKKSEEIINIIYITSYILEKNRFTVKYRDSYAEQLFYNFKEQINNSYKIYKNNLKIMCINFFFENLIPLTILKMSLNKNDSININTENKNKKEKNIFKIKAIKSDYDDKIRKLFEDYEKMFSEKTTYLNKFIDNNKQFNEEIKNIDFDIKMYIKDMYQKINVLMKEFNDKIAEIIKDFLNDLNCNIELQKFSAIQEMAASNIGIGLATGGLIGGGLSIGFGVGAASSAAAAIEIGVGASLAIPVVGIVVGSVATIFGGAYLLYRIFKKKSSLNKEQITKFEQANKKEIEKSKKQILNAIIEVMNKAIKKINDFYSILEENLDEFRENKDLFERYYFEYENIIQQGFGLL